MIRLISFPGLRYDESHQKISDVVTSSLPNQTSKVLGRADMEVTGPGSIQGSTPIKQTPQTPEMQPATESKSASPLDEVEISSAGKMLDSLGQSSKVRSERLAQIKSEIEAGTYETPEKLEAALEKLLVEFDVDEGNER